MTGKLYLLFFSFSFLFFLNQNIIIKFLFWIPFTQEYLDLYFSSLMDIIQYASIDLYAIWVDLLVCLH